MNWLVEMSEAEGSDSDGRRSDSRAKWQTRRGHGADVIHVAKTSRTLLAPAVALSSPASPAPLFRSLWMITLPA